VSGPNEYDSLLDAPDAAAPPAAPASLGVYDDALQEIDKEKRIGLRQSLTGAVALGNPDAAAKALNLAGKTGLPADVVERNLPTVQAQSDVNDYDALLAKSPRTAAWLLDRDNAKVALTEYDKLTGIERVWNEVVRTGKNLEAGVLAAHAAFNVMGVRQIDELQAHADKGGALSRRDEISLALGKQARDRTLMSIAQSLPAAIAAGDEAAAIPQRPATAAFMAAGDDAGKMLDAFTTDPVGIIQDILAQSLPAAVPAMIAGAVGGIPAAVGVGGASSAGMEFFSGLLENIKAMGVDVRNPDALLAAMQDRELMATVFRRTGTKAGLVGLFDAASAGLAGRVLTPFIAGPLKREAANMGAQMVAQGAMGGAGEVAGQVAATGELPQLSAVVAEVIGEVGSAPVDVASLAIGEGKRRTAPGLAEQATADIAGFNQVAATLAESGVLQRAPDRVAAFLASLSDGEETSVYLPADKVSEYFQTLPEDQARQFAQDWGLAKQLPEALAIGGDVLIPAELYLTKVVPAGAHDLFSDTLRLTADGLSIAGAKIWEANYKKWSAGADDAALDTQETPDAGQQIFAEIFAKARAADFTVDAAQKYAALYASRYVNRGARLGIEPLEAFKRSGIDIRRELPGVLRTVPPDSLDLLVRALRKGRDGGTLRSIQGWTLAEWLAKRGGVSDRGGELRAMDADKWHKGKPGRKRLAHVPPGDEGPALIPGQPAAKGKGESLDDAALAAWEAGYFPEFTDRPSEDALLEAIRDELSGRARYSANDDARGDGAEWKLNLNAALDDLEKVLDNLGVDLATATDAEVRAALDRYQTDNADAPVGEGFENFEQAFRPKAFVEFGRQIIEAIAGRLPDHARLSLGRTPASLRLAGAPDRALVMRASVAKKVVRGGEGEHVVPQDVLERLGDHLARPVAVFKSDTHDNALAVLIDAFDEVGDAIIVAVHLADKEVSVNRITSLYGKERRMWFSDQLDAGHLLYVDKEKSQRWEVKVRNQYPNVSRLSGFAATGSGRKIFTEIDLVKGGGGEFNQPDGSGMARGKVTFGSGRSIITLFRHANLSTMLHETGHLWLEELAADASLPDAPDQLRADLATVLGWFGVERFDQVKVEHHEQWARAAEAYLLEGKAPSIGLQGAFSRFRAWLKSIYQVIANLNTPINDEIRGVFDRLLATDEEIATAREQQKLTQLFKTADEAGMSEAEFAAYNTAVAKARDKATDKLLDKVMGDVRKRRTREWKEELAAVKAEVAVDIDRAADLRAR